MTTRTTPPLTFRAAKAVLRCRPGVWPDAMVDEAQDAYHAANRRTIAQIRECDLVTDVTEPNARTEPEGSDTPEANKLADAVMTFVLGSAGVTLLAMWWLA